MDNPTGIIAAYDTEEIRQVRKIATHTAERERPGNKQHAFLRGKQAVGRYRIKERRYYELHVNANEDWLMAIDAERAVTMRDDYNTFLVREILDLLPFTIKDEVLTALLSNDGKRIGRVGRLIRETLPKLTEDHDE